MSNANNSFRGIILSALKHNKDGSFTTQHNRQNILLKMSKDLSQAGHKNVTAKNFGAKHCYILRDRWQSQGLSTATIKNRLACVRWLGEKLGKELPDNKKLEIENRVYSDNTKNKAQEIDPEKLAKLNEKQQLAIRLQREFGLRREESLKFMTSYEIKAEKIELKSSWTKGGRAREIPITTDKQRELLKEVEKIAGKGSLIEKEQKYHQAREALDKACQRAEIRNMHGFRHAYAQQRYKVLTGRDCPKAGGLTSKQLRLSRYNIQDYSVRLKISEELGHNREEITVQYLGR